MIFYRKYFYTFLTCFFVFFCSHLLNAQCNNVRVRGGLNPLCDSTKLNWASWTSVNATTGIGYISSDLNVTVTKPTGGLSTTGGMYNGGVFPTQYTVPANSTAIRNDLAGLFTFCFNQPVVNPQIALSSIGNGSNSVQINTSAPYQVIWQGLGMNYPNSTTFVGTEGFTIIKFPGVHTCISFDYLQSESYCNLAFGVLDTNCQALVPQPRCIGMGADTLTASGAVTYSWTPAAGLNTTTGAVVAASPTVTTTYYVTGIDANNCSATDSITITVNPSPVAAISGDTVICAGDSTTLTASGGNTYLWKPGNQTNSAVTLSPTTNTTYTVVVSNSSGCTDSSVVNIIVNPAVVATATVQSIGCVDSSGVANVTATSGTAPYTYSWNTTPVQVTQNVTNLPVGNYIATVTDDKGCLDTSSVTITQALPPAVKVRGALNPLCDSTKLNWASWTSVSATTGIGYISSDLNVTVSKPSGGLGTTGGMFSGSVFPTQYDVPINNTAILNQLAGVFTFCFNQPVLSPQIALSSIGNSGNSVPVVTSVPYQVIWQGQGMSYPNDTTFVGTEGYTIIKFPGVHTCISFNYLQSEYYCNLAFGVLDTNCQSLAPVPKCFGAGSDTLTASGASNYSWTPATGLNTTTGAVVVATPTVTTTYYVTGYDSNPQCSSTDSITVIINPAPTAVITGDTIICAGDSTTLTASGGNFYLWKPINDTTPSVTLSPATTSAYKVVVANTFGCTDSSTVNIVVNPLPVAQFTVPPVCWNNPSVFTQTSTGNISTSDWSFGDNLSSNVQNPTHTYVTCDSFDVRLIVTSVDGCIDTVENTAVVNCLPVANFSYDDVCRNTQADFEDLSTVVGDTITQWLWNAGVGGTTATTQDFSHTYTADGTYTITLVVTSAQGGCSDTAQNSIVIHPIPVPQITANNICAGSIVPFTNTSTIAPPDNILSFVWDFADGNPVYNNPSILHSYPNVGSYPVKLTVVSNFGCADSVTKMVTVNPNPVVDFTATDTAGCFPFCISFQDMSTIASPATLAQWAWDLGDSSGVASSQTFDHCYSNVSHISPVTYSVTLTVTSDSGCVTMLTKDNYITVYPKPNAVFTASPQETNFVDPVIAVNNLSEGGIGYEWSWDDGAMDSLITPLPHTYLDTGTYTVTLITTNQYGCEDDTTQQVIIKPTFTLYIPNAFSPNGDGVNDVFSVTGMFITEFSMLIYDRWGNRIYETDDITAPWDGKINNGTEPALQDTYVYVIYARDFKKDKHYYRGIVTLVTGKK